MRVLEANELVQDAVPEGEQVDMNPASAKVGGGSKEGQKYYGERQLKPYDYKVGVKDNDGEVVVKIYSKSLSHVVYRTDRAIRVDIDDEHSDMGFIAKMHYGLSVDLARIYSLLPENLSRSESINRLVARAITANTSGNSGPAKEILAQAEERLIKLKTIQGRLEYTISALLVVSLVFVVSVFYGLESAPILVNIALLGSLGGVLSIALGFSSLEIDLDASRMVNCLIGASRILIAIVASVFSYFAIKADLAFSFVEKAPDNVGFYMMAMVAGFAEMLIPNVMSNLMKDDGGKVRDDTK